MFKYLYISLIALSSALVTLKFFAYSVFLEPLEFGLFSKGLIVSSLLVLIGSGGLNIKLHRELPVLLNGNSRAKVKARILVLLTKDVSVLIFCILLGLLSLCHLLLGFNYNLLFLGLAHGFLLNLVYLDLIEIKSKLQFYRYGKILLFRTICMSFFGLLAGYYTKNANVVLFFEALALLSMEVKYFKGLICYRMASLSPKLLKHKALKRLIENKSLLVLSLSSVLLLNLDKWIAAGFLSNEDFGYYAFYWLLISVGINFQQALNIKFMPSAAILIKESRRNGYFYLLKNSFIIFLMVTILTLLFKPLIQTVIQEYFSDYHLKIYLLPLVLCMMIIRVSDYLSNFLLLLKKESLIIKSIFMNSIIFGALFFTAVKYEADLMHSLLAIGIFVNFLHILYITICSYYSSLK